MKAISNTLFHSNHSIERARAQLLTDSDIHEIYVRGVWRNLMSMFCRTFGADANAYFQDANRVSGGNRDRGNCSYDLLVFLFSQKRLQWVLAQLMKTMKNSKQGGAGYRDLGLAHCLLCVLQQEQNGKHERHGDVIVSSMALGRVISPLSKLTAKTIDMFGLEALAKITATQLEKEFPKESHAVDEAVAASMDVHKKSNRLEKLDLSNDRLVRAFSIVTLTGIHEHPPFESFLK